VALLYAIVDVDTLARRSWPAVEVARAVLAGGARRLQLRAKQAGRDELRSWATEIAALSEALGPGGFVVNDDVALALELGVGVHVGQADCSPRVARELAAGRPLTIGLSTHDEEQLYAALLEPVDYVAIGPVFATASKLRPDPVLGLDRTSRMVADARARAPTTPLCAIGGVGIEAAAALAALDWVAVIGALLPDPVLPAKEAMRRIEQLTREMSKALEGK
jgi:thiamine-phosphate pyrophosphorylase